MHIDHPTPDRLAQTFADLAELAYDYDVGECVHLLAHAAAEVAGASTGGVLLATHSGGLEIAATLSPESATVESVQLDTDAGPCVDAARSGQVVAADDLAAMSDRWPGALAEQVRDLGIRAAYAQPIGFRGEIIGALNLYWEEPTTLAPEQVAVVAAMADVVAIGITQQRAVIGQEQHTTHLRQAFDTRTVVEQAKGLLASRHGITPAKAFQALRRYARDHRVKVADVSAQLIATVEGDATALDAKIADRIDG